MTIDDDRIEQLLDELENDPDWEEHWANGGDLVWETYPEMVEPLLNRLDVNDERTHRRAVQALGWISDDRAVEPLRDAVETLPDIRFEIIQALGRIGAVDDVIQIFHEYDEDDEETVRLYAIHTLGLHCNDQAVTVLLQALEDGTTEERRNAASALGACRNKSSFETLVELLEDDDPDVRTWAAQGLWNYMYEYKRDFESGSILESLRRWLGLSVGDETVVETVDRLLDRLDDDAELVRRQSTIAVGRIASYGLINTSYVRPALVDVQENDSSTDVRDVASTELDRLAE